MRQEKFWNNSRNRQLRLNCALLVSCIFSVLWTKIRQIFHVIVILD